MIHKYWCRGCGDRITVGDAGYCRAEECAAEGRRIAKRGAATSREDMIAAVGMTTDRYSETMMGLLRAHHYDEPTPALTSAYALWREGKDPLPIQSPAGSVVSTDPPRLTPIVGSVITDVGYVRYKVLSIGAATVRCHDIAGGMSIDVPLRAWSMPATMRRVDAPDGIVRPKQMWRWRNGIPFIVGAVTHSYASVRSASGVNHDISLVDGRFKDPDWTLVEDVA